MAHDTSMLPQYRLSTTTRKPKPRKVQGTARTISLRTVSAPNSTVNHSAPHAEGWNLRSINKYDISACRTASGPCPTPVPRESRTLSRHELQTRAANQVSQGSQWTSESTFVSAVLVLRSQDANWLDLKNELGHQGPLEVMTLDWPKFSEVLDSKLNKHSHESQPWSLGLRSEVKMVK